MCILFIYTDPSPPKGGYRLIVASNRDEYYKRPAKCVYHCADTNIIGGRDMEPGREGGMWLGLSLKQNLIKFAALLNVTGAEKMTATSGRGPLVFNYLKSEQSATEYARDLHNDTYSAFNLFMMEIAKEKSSAYHHSNSPAATHEYHGRQILAFGNSTPDVPFKKVTVGKQKFEKIILESQDKDNLISRLVDLLRCQDLHLPDLELERRAPAGVNFLSSIYVNMKEGGYGTRTHSVILVDADCNVEFVEHTMKEPIDANNPRWEVNVVKSQL